MLITIVTFVIILGVLVLVHELGHFFAARFFGVKAEEFGFGYPPRICGLVKNNNSRWISVGHQEKAENYNNTIWSINWLPLGGFVNIKGQDSNQKGDNDSFGSKTLWQRFVMLFAGVGMNFVLSFLLLSICFMAGVPTMIDDESPAGASFMEEKIQIMSIADNSPANEAGLMIGDTIVSVNQKEIKNIAEMQSITNENRDKIIEIIIARGGEKIEKDLMPRIMADSGDRAVVGVGLVKTAIISYSWYRAIYEGLINTFLLAWAIVTALWGVFVGLITTGKVTAEVAGPVGIAVLTGQVAQLGFVYVLQFVALLSLNLAIINILPIPALDGGRILFLIFEKIKGAPVKQKVEGMIHQIGFMLLLALMALVIFKDLRNYGAGIWGAIAGWF